MPYRISRAAYADMFGPTVGDKVRLKRPWTVMWRGRYRTYRVGVVEEVLGDGTLFGLKFSSYPNTVDMGRSLLDLPGLPQ